LAFVAGRRCVVEVRAAGGVDEGATRRFHITKLLRGDGHDGGGENRIALLHYWVIGEIGVTYERPDTQATGRRVLDLLQRQPRDVDHLRRPFDIHLHQIDQISTAGDEFRVWV